MNLVSMTDAAHELGISRQRMHQIVNDKKIPALTIGQQKFVDRNDLEAFKLQRKKENK